MAMQTEEKLHGDIRQWLLGLLPQQESYSLEELLITDAALYEELHIVEDELIDEYLGGTLTTNEREAFESYFINSPERQEQFRIANALKVYIDDSKQDASDSPPLESSVAPAESRWTPFRKAIAVVSMAAAVLLIVVLGWYLLLVGSPSPSNSLSVILTPAVQTRAGGPVQTVRVPLGTRYLHLQLKLARNDYQKYRVTVVNSDGNVVQANENLTPSTDTGGPAVQFYVSASQMPPGEYQLKLDGVADGKFESADGYRFVVTPQ